MNGLELASRVSTNKPYYFGDENSKYKIAILDLGVKMNILKNLSKRNAYMKVFPHNSKYEDMKKDLKPAISQIAAFIGANISGDIIAKIADLTGFEKMKDDNTANYSRSESHQKEPFMRKGVVGDWKNFLSAEQSAQMDAICAKRLKDTGLEFVYEL